MLAVKIILLLSLFGILFQDIKERNVYWFLFPIVACAAGYLYFSNTFSALFWQTVMVNFGVVVLILLVLQIYAKLRLKTNLQNVFGLGDALLFFALCVSFPIASFIIFFVFSLLFSLMIHFVFKNKTQLQTVPLAGYMSLFFIGIYLMNWTGMLTNIYSV
ncbi:hypothetical protein [Kordia zhangzhouensis]|uniref:hypothetical protein n=1 Tax=Kordia zhangzhouensis TaxID=1620405 RepID=UPI00062928D5|nr:hypothetical protein [Kordia zhangzhouensis]